MNLCLSICTALLPILVASECVLSPNERNIFLWSVSDTNSGVRGYLFGTIHVPYTEVWDQISDRVREAFSFSDSVLLEIDLHDNSTLRKLAQCKNLPKKETARSYLPSHLYKRVASLMRGYRKLSSLKRGRTSSSRKPSQTGLIENWYRKRPEWLLFLLYHISDDYPLRSSTPILDAYIAQQAFEKAKSLGSIESVDEQCSPITSLSSNDIVFAINYTVGYLEQKHKDSAPLSKPDLHQHMNQLIQSYRCGNLDHLLDLNDLALFGISSNSSLEKRRAEEINQALKEDILFKRNSLMAQRLHQHFLKTPNRILFTAIGIGHFLGKSNIIRSLRAMGYIVQSVKHDYRLSIERRRPRLRIKSLWKKDENIAPSSSCRDKSAFALITLFFIMFPNRY